MEQWSARLPHKQKVVSSNLSPAPNLGVYIAKDAMQSVKLMPLCWSGSLPETPTNLRIKDYGSLSRCQRDGGRSTRPIRAKNNAEIAQW
jgi:hypothetical protein